MTTQLDGPFRGLAFTLSNALGKLGRIEYVITSGYNTTAGAATQSVNTTKQVRGVLASYAASEIDGTYVRRGDLRWEVPAKPIDEPRPNDTALIDGTRYTILAVDSVFSGDLVALYRLQLRR